jgi:predicted DNA-binding transcriptional regulator AlpA
MTQAELDDLPVSIDIVTAGRALGIGRSLSYELAHNGTFPVRVMRLGSSYRVTRADLLTYLGGAGLPRSA